MPCILPFGSPLAAAVEQSLVLTAPTAAAAAAAIEEDAGSLTITLMFWMFC